MGAHWVEVAGFGAGRQRRTAALEREASDVRASLGTHPERSSPYPSSSATRRRRSSKVRSALAAVISAASSTLQSGSVSPVCARSWHETRRGSPGRGTVLEPLTGRSNASGTIAIVRQRGGLRSPDDADVVGAE